MRRILFVGAPFGQFFSYLAPALERRGTVVLRTVSDGGEFFATPPRNRIVVRGACELDECAWEKCLEQVMIERHISAVITFNDTCRRAKAAHLVATRLGIQRYVLEEGYLRPWWVTFDHEGVNGNSLLPKDPQFYIDQDLPTVSHETFEQSFRFLVRDILIHYAGCIALSPILPYDKRYYGDSIWAQAFGYSREFLRRRRLDERPVLAALRIAHAADRPIFVALMQKPGDSQLRHHSPYPSNNSYLDQVLASFARAAERDAILVVKQHPLDYGVEYSEEFFEKLVAEHGLEGRACYTRTLTIEQVLDIAAGLVTINSTGGLAAVERLVPTITLGNAIYNMPRLTFQGGIDRFWCEASKPDPAAVSAFVNYLKARTQINGGYYSHRQLTMVVDALVGKLAVGGLAPHVQQTAQDATMPARAPEFEPAPVTVRAVV